MKDWKLSEAKAHFSEVVSRSSEEPQRLVNRDKPVAAIIGIEALERFQNLERESARPSMADLLEEIANLNKEEADLEIPDRNDRALPAFD